MASASSHSSHRNIGWVWILFLFTLNLTMALHSFAPDKLKTTADGSSRQCWSVIREMLHSTPPFEILSAHLCQDLFNNFANFFVKKIYKVKTDIAARLPSIQKSNIPSDPIHCGQVFGSITPPTVEEVDKLLSFLPAKSSSVYSVPTSLIQSCLTVFAPIITRLVQLWFAGGEFLAKFRSASVMPIPKKGGNDSDNPANFLPISNLNSIFRRSWNDYFWWEYYNIYIAHQISTVINLPTDGVIQPRWLNFIFLMTSTMHPNRRWLLCWSHWTYWQSLILLTTWCYSGLS